MKNQDAILAEMQGLRTKIDQAVASQQLVGIEGYRLLMAAVADEIRTQGKRLMQFDCTQDETNALRAGIRALNWFSSWSVKRADELQGFVKRMEGLQTLVQKRHDQGVEPIGPEAEQLLGQIRQLKTEVLTHG